MKKKKKLKENITEQILLGIAWFRDQISIRNGHPSFKNELNFDIVLFSACKLFSASSGTKDTPIRCS